MTSEFRSEESKFTTRKWSQILSSKQTSDKSCNEGAFKRIGNGRINQKVYDKKYYIGWSVVYGRNFELDVINEERQFHSSL